VCLFQPSTITRVGLGIKESHEQLMPKSSKYPREDGDYKPQKRNQFNLKLKANKKEKLTTTMIKITTTTAQVVQK
jgi:hypothetical protein